MICPTMLHTKWVEEESERVKRKECGREPRAVLGHSCARISKRSFFLEILADDRV